MTTKPDMPKYCFARGERIWVRLKREDGKWKNDPTPYNVGQEELAGRYAKAMLRGIAMKKTSGDPNLTTVALYGERWLKDRETRGVASAVDERSRLEKYVYPYLGALGMEEVRPHHARDMIRGLKARKGDEKLAPRTILHCFRAAHNMFSSAVIEEILVGNPIVVERHELPKKIDCDPEWRPNAGYTLDEVKQLLTEAILPTERRVMYALKSLAGLRHGEAAAFCWRHRDQSAEPLAKLNVLQAFCSRKSEIKSVKSELVRAVPEHPTLTKILDVWRNVHWPRIYGRKPGPDDLVVPTRNMTCINVADANEAFKRDLDALKLRKEAGSKRDRGGHDLRSWFMTNLAEDGADSLIARRATHAPPKDVDGGYKRLSWKSICREIAKLNIELLDDDILKLVTFPSHTEAKARGRWQKAVTPSGLEGEIESGYQRAQVRVVDGKAYQDLATRVRRRTLGVTTPLQTAARMLTQAADAGDMPRVLEIARQLADLRPRR